MAIKKRPLSARQKMINNFIAHDLLHGCRHFANRYTEQQRQDFTRHIQQLERYGDYDVGQLLDILLGIYANPVDNTRRAAL